MYALTKPLLFRLDPERAHRMVIRGVAGMGPIARGLSTLALGRQDPRLASTIAGLRFPTPIGLAAGLDKDGELARYWPCLGFGFIELGTVTAHPQPGNPPPRLFRFPTQEALVNRMGFNNKGSETLARHLRRLRDKGWQPDVPVGINVGKSKITPLEEAPTDYVTSVARLVEVADYFVVNVSSPNTPGLRSLQAPDALSRILEGVRQAARDVPVFVKLSPNLEDEALKELVGVVEAQGVSGLVATNTTTERYGLPDVGAGGLSGRPLHPRSVEVVRRLASHTNLPIIGVGGISQLEDVLNMLEAGARAVQIYSALIFRGPGLVKTLLRELAQEMDKRGLNHVGDLIASGDTDVS